MRRILCCGLIWVGTLGPAWVRADEGMEGRIGEVLRSEGYAEGHWGILVVDGKTGESVFELNADQLFRPASVTKLFSTAAAMVGLGADHRFETPVYRRGEIGPDGALRGDLILVAGGDPCLGGRTGPDGTLLYTDEDHSYAEGHLKSTLVAADPLAGIDSLARDVHAAGIRAINGNVIIDDRLFDLAPSTGSGPSRVSPIVVNDNLIDMVVTPAARAGEPATVKTVPETAFVSVDARVETAPEGTRPWVAVRSAGPRRCTVRGRLPIGHAPVVKIYEVEEPADFARAVFIEALRRRGVRVDASPLAENPRGDLPSRAEVAGLPKVAQYTSPPFREYVKVILKVSQNLHASTLPLLLAAKQGERTLADGLRREAALLRELGVDTDAISFGGGAGGSSADLVTPRATVALLRAMAARPEFPAYEAALPILGRDGTLAHTVGPDSPSRGHVRAKTGTYWIHNGLNGRAILTSKALAGTMETASGRPLVFAIFLNDVPLETPSDDVSGATAAAGRLLGRLCEVLYDDQLPVAEADGPDGPAPPATEAQGTAPAGAPATDRP